MRFWISNHAASVTQDCVTFDGTDRYTFGQFSVAGQIWCTTQLRGMQESPSGHFQFARSEVECAQQAMDGSSGRWQSGGPRGPLPIPTSSCSVPGQSSQSLECASLSCVPRGTERGGGERITHGPSAIQQRWLTHENRAEEKPSKMSKRPRVEVVAPSERKCVYMLGLDDLVNLVHVDMTLLRHYGCRTQKSIDNNDPPFYVETDGVPVYAVWMKRQMIVCFLTSLSVGKMCLDNSITYSQATAMFDYEGICVPSTSDAEEYAKLGYSIEGQSMGIGMNKRQESLLDSMARIAETISNAIMEWPRLEHGLESSFAADDEATEHAPVGFTCTPTRCWIRFMQPPRHLIEAGADPTYALCKRRPYWLAATLYAIGSVHARLVILQKIKREDRSEAAFFALEEGIKSDPCHHFASTRVDVPKAWRERAKKVLGDAERFAITMLNLVTSNGPFKEGEKMSTSCKYARACVGLAHKLATNTPKIGKMFSHGCEDDKGVTPERFALAKALKTHGIKVIKWGNDDNALIFPPSFRGLDAGKPEGPCVLLGFENMR